KPLTFTAREEWQTDARTRGGGAAETIAAQGPASARPTTDSDVPVKPIATPPRRRDEKRTVAPWHPRAATADKRPQDGSQAMARPGQVLVDLEEEKLDRRLLFLAREAESAMQEQGCNILYASFGLLD